MAFTEREEWASLRCTPPLKAGSHVLFINLGERSGDWAMPPPLLWGALQEVEAEHHVWVNNSCIKFNHTNTSVITTTTCEKVVNSLLLNIKSVKNKGAL
jgi:hypothetical protein